MMVADDALGATDPSLRNFPAYQSIGQSVSISVSQSQSNIQSVGFFVCQQVAHVFTTIYCGCNALGVILTGLKEAKVSASYQSEGKRRKENI